MTAVNPDALPNAQGESGESVETIVARNVAAIFARVVTADEGASNAEEGRMPAFDSRAQFLSWKDAGGCSMQQE